MLVAGYLYGGAGLLKRYKLGATIANAGIIAINGLAGIIPCTATDTADSPGLILDTATFSTTQGDVEGIVTVDVRPDAIIRALMSGGATENTALQELSNTSQDTGGTTVTDGDVGSADMDSGTVWRLIGSTGGESRLITTHNSGTDFVVTVPFTNDIEVGDTFLFCPWGLQGAGGAGDDGVGNLQPSTLFTQADASIASGDPAAGLISIVDLELNAADNSFVLFTNQDHIHSHATV